MTPQDPDDRAARLGDDLKLAFRALASPDVAEDRRPDWHRRLIAITNSAKHDVATAEGRMARWWADFEAEVGPRPHAGD
ncbi:hypothetical protein [Euzebya sp.]|uniref:hypothetical protein n=1 Tax=Euzebya sp. TaxID=1971409 RepID=UPI0035165406